MPKVFYLGFPSCVVKNHDSDPDFVSEAELTRLKIILRQVAQRHDGGEAAFDRYIKEFESLQAKDADQASIKTARRLLIHSVTGFRHIVLQYIQQLAEEINTRIVAEAKHEEQADDDEKAQKKLQESLKSWTNEFQTFQKRIESWKVRARTKGLRHQDAAFVRNMLGKFNKSCHIDCEEIMTGEFMFIAEFILLEPSLSWR